jgi:hypothetical protein
MMTSFKPEIYIVESNENAKNKLDVGCWVVVCHKIVARTCVPALTFDFVHGIDQSIKL